jgi:hypothetical protein
MRLVDSDVVMMNTVKKFTMDLTIIYLQIDAASVVFKDHMTNSRISGRLPITSLTMTSSVSSPCFKLAYSSIPIIC